MEILQDIMDRTSLKDFLFVEDDLVSFTHRTDTKLACDNILETGFIFSESFHKTTDRIINDDVYLNYWSLQRKYYGEFIVVISFARFIMEDIQEKVIQHEQFIEVQQLLSRKLDEKDDDDESRFLLPMFYVKGIYHLASDEIIVNPFYNPFFLPSKTQDFLDKLS